MLKGENVDDHAFSSRVFQLITVYVSGLQKYHISLTMKLIVTENLWIVFEITNFLIIYKTTSHFKELEQYLTLQEISTMFDFIH